MFWLMKTEPSTYAWNDLVRDTAVKGGEEWSGVRNYEARNNMRKMKIGDSVFIYHSVDEKAIVGIGEVVKEVHQDSTDTSGVWECVDVGAIKPFKRSISLKEIKELPGCQEMVLIRKGRLSVQPVMEREWFVILEKVERP